MLGHELLPTDAPSVAAICRLVRIESCLLTSQLFVRRKVRANEVTILRAFQRLVLETQFQPGDFAGFAIADEPRVRIGAVASLGHDSNPVVYRFRILRGAAEPSKLRNALRIEPLELRDCRLGDH